RNTTVGQSLTIAISNPQAHHLKPAGGCFQILKPIIRNPREFPQTPTSRGLRNTQVDKSLTSRGLRNTTVGQSLTIAISNPQAHHLKPAGGFTNPDLPRVL
ncbi:MAG: hypothetical protein WBF05_14975, partial [Anaerolineales bacterium]